MMCTVTVRRIKPGAYDAFRKAWEPDAWWPKCIRAEVLRNDDDPQQVMTLGYFDATPEEFDQLAHDDALLQGETRRLERIAEVEELLVMNTTFELVEDVRP